MQWTTFTLAGRALTHVEQEQNTNQCVAASLAMVCKNAGYSGHRFGEGSLFTHGAAAMRQINVGLQGNGVSDKAFVSQHGIRHNAVAAYLQRYGFSNVRTLTVANDGANAVANAVNNMNDGDSAILACGVDQFHALAAFKRGTTIYVMNPMPADNHGRAFAYTNQNAVQALNHGQQNAQVPFVDPPSHGPAYWRSVDACFSIPSQWYLGTIKRWLVG